MRNTLYFGPMLPSSMRSSSTSVDSNVSDSSQIVVTPFAVNTRRSPVSSERRMVAASGSGSGTMPSRLISRPFNCPSEPICTEPGPSPPCLTPM